MSKLQAQGGSISFLEGDKSQLSLAYVNGSHEYVVFNPSSDETHERSAVDYEGLVGDEETGKFKTYLERNFLKFLKFLKLSKVSFEPLY